MTIYTIIATSTFTIYIFTGPTVGPTIPGDEDNFVGVFRAHILRLSSREKTN
jgi:hypothetical protein